MKVMEVSVSVHQVLMHCEIHAIDLGIIITLINVILLAFLEIVESVIDMQGSKTRGKQL